MAIEITICNRQRTVSVDRNWMQDMCERVLSAVCCNLAQGQVLPIKPEVLQDLEHRGQLSLTLVSNRQMQKLNARWRGKNQPTDVLSFPLEYEPPPAGLPWPIGEVVISVEQARQQAKQYGHGWQRELAFLFAHGVLHVLGFDHQTPEEEKEMFWRQERALEAAGFKR